MRTKAPAALPIFRSEQQMRILGVLFAQRSAEYSVSELASRASVAVATASREVERLAEHGLVAARTLGRMRMVSANWELPWAGELASILAQTVGVSAAVADALAEVEGVERVYLYGSWAARQAGEEGPPPNDIDVLVVGVVALDKVRVAVRGLEDTLGLEINPVVVTAEQWASASDPFLDELRERPLVSVLPRRNDD